MTEQDNDKVRCINFIRRRDNPGRIEWEYRCNGVGMLVYMMCPVTGDGARVIYKREIPHNVQEGFNEALRAATERRFTDDGWTVNIPEDVMQEVDKYLDDVLAAKTEMEEENERLGF